jgi:hypothetical protein
MTSNRDTITLKSSVWNYTALKEDDPYLSELIPPIETLQGSELEIPESLASIIANEWGAYLRLQAALNEVWAMTGIVNKVALKYNTLSKYDITSIQEITLRDILMGKLTSILNPMNMRSESAIPIVYAGLWRSAYVTREGSILIVSKSFTQDIPLIYLSEVSHISRIANMPQNWEYLVTINSDTPQNERIHHIRRIGEIADACSGHSGAFARSDMGTPIPGLKASLKEHDQAYMQFIRGLEIIQRRRSDANHTANLEVLDWRGIIWDDIIPAFNLIQSETKLPYPRSEYLNTVAYLTNNEMYDSSIPIPYDCILVSKSAALSQLAYKGLDIPLFNATIDRDEEMRLALCNMLERRYPTAETLPIDRPRGSLPLISFTS